MPSITITVTRVIRRVKDWFFCYLTVLAQLQALCSAESDERLSSWKAKKKLENDITFDLMDTGSGAVLLEYWLRGEP
jgi:RNase H-fold protein (predicted Holliday junction resolvase)